MDLGISGRKAIVCASSRGLGRACAFALAEAGCEVVINGRDAAKLEATAAQIVKATGAMVISVNADVGTAEGQAKLFAACPQPDILVNNNAGRWRSNSSRKSSIPWWRAALAASSTSPRAR
jgi:3-oxoacyl-[acyl-carrier protein] reductase